MTSPALRSLRHPWLPVAALGACLLLELAVLPVGIDDLDEGYFAQQAVRVWHGQVPYRDFESLYTPGLAYVHAGLFALLGSPLLIAPRALSLATRAGVAVLLYLLTRPLVDKPLWAAVPAIFLLVGFDDAPDRWEPHPGWPSTLFALLAVWCITHQPSRRWLLASGLAAAAAYVFKQNAGAFVLAALVLREVRRPRRAALVLAGFGGLTVVWLVPLVLAIGGRIELLGAFVGAVSQAGLVSPPEPTIVIPLLCLAAGLWLVRTSHEPRMRWYVLAGTSLFLTQYPRGDSLHLAWSAPLLLVLGAVALQRIPALLAALVIAAAAFVCLPTIRGRIDQVRLSTTVIQGIPAANGLRVPATTWSDLVNTIGEIQHRTAPGEPILVYPTSPLLYVLAERPNPTRFDHLNPGAANPAQIQQVVAQVHDAGVRLTVISEFWRRAWGPARDNVSLEEWLFAHFKEVARFGQYRVFVRADAGL